jgi:hypothetical protein
MVSEILLGDNPFIGVSHLAQEKAREEKKALSTVQAKAEVIRAAIEGGATGFTFSTHPLNFELLQYMRDEHPSILQSLNYYLLTPYAQSYVRQANILGTANLVKSLGRDIALESPIGMLTALLTLNLNKIAGLFIAREVKHYLKILPKENVKAILLHEVLTELIIAFGLADLLEELKKHVEIKLGVGFGVETRNLYHLERFLNENSLHIDYVMTPMNPLGYQMGTKELAENSVKALSNKGVKIIAINILASGACSIEEATTYLRAFKEHIYAVAFGTSKPNRARANAQYLRTNLM